MRAADRRHIEVNISNRAGGRANHLMCCEVHRVTRGVTVPDILSCVCACVRVEHVCLWTGYTSVQSPLSQQLPQQGGESGRVSALQAAVNNS